MPVNAIGCLLFTASFSERKPAVPWSFLFFIDDSTVGACFYSLYVTTNSLFFAFPFSEFSLRVEASGVEYSQNAGVWYNGTRTVYRVPLQYCMLVPLVAVADE